MPDRPHIYSPPRRRRRRRADSRPLGSLQSRFTLPLTSHTPFLDLSDERGRGHTMAGSPYSSRGAMAARAQVEEAEKQEAQSVAANVPDADLVTQTDRGRGTRPVATACRSVPAPVGLVRPSATWKEPGSHVTEARVPSW